MKRIAILSLIAAPCVVAQLPAEKAAEIRRSGEQHGMSEAGIVMVISREAAKLRDEQVADLRRQIAEPWTSLKVGCGYACYDVSGATVTGFEISRDSDSVSIAPWTNGVDSQPAADKKRLEEGEVEKLLSEIVLHFLVAVTSVHPIEISGPAPDHPAQLEQIEKWEAAYVAAGGSLRGGDSYWIDLRFTTQDGEVVRVKNRYASPLPREFGDWVSRYSSERSRKFIRLLSAH
jgi:hypothetical protein